MKIWLCICLICAFWIPACERDTATPALPSGPTIDEQVLKNCLTIQSAAEAYAAQSGGQYAIEPDDDRYGYSLIDFLPDSIRLTNPVTGDTTEPVFPEPSGLGSTSYRGVGVYDDEWRMWCIGYMIVGRGESSEIIISNVADSILQLEDIVIEHCLAVQTAVETFAAENGGIYPMDVSADETPTGHTVIDILPEGRLLENPYTNLRTSPVNGAAALPGETGYLVIEDMSHTYTGYMITGWGFYWQIYTILKDPAN